jgi:hypothetical protein
MSSYCLRSGGLVLDEIMIGVPYYSEAFGRHHGTVRITEQGPVRTLTLRLIMTMRSTYINYI